MTYIINVTEKETILKGEMMESAIEVKDVFVPKKEHTDENGTRWLIFNYCEDNKDPWKWPKVLKYQSRLYYWMSWNSDNLHVNYKEISENDLATIVRKK